MSLQGRVRLTTWNVAPFRDRVPFVNRHFSVSFSLSSITVRERGQFSSRDVRWKAHLSGAMLGDYLTALLIAVLGYVYPAYLCFKVRRRVYALPLGAPTRI